MKRVPARPRDLEEDDPYANAALKYAALFDLEPGARVSLQGPHWARMAPEFEAAGFTVSTAPAPDAALVALDLTHIRSRREANDAILGLRESLAPDGIAAVLTTNALAPSNFGQGLTPGQTRRAIAKAGLSLLREYLPLPMLDSVEVFEACSGQRVNLRRDERWFKRVLARLGLYSMVHPTRLYFCTADKMRDRLPLAWVARWHLAGMEADPGPLAMQRYYLRRRGALLVVLHTEVDARSLVLRVATSDKVAEALERNAASAERVRTYPALDESVRALVPRSMGSFVERGRRAFIEEYREGDPGWMLGRSARHEERVREQAFRILHRLQRDTAVPTRLDDQAIDRLLGATFAAVGSWFESSPGALGLLKELRDRLVAGLAGRTMSLVWAHGDYGLGNLLTDPGGTVTALIDWDTFNDADLPGVDWCHFVLSADRNAGLDEIASTRGMIEAARSTGYLAPDFKGFGQDDFGLNPGDMIRIPCLSTLRDLARSAVYPSEFRSGMEGYLEKFTQLNQMLAEADGR